MNYSEGCDCEICLLAEQERLSVEQSQSEFTSAMRAFKRSHNSGHVMTFEQCDGCDLIIAWQSLKGRKE